MKEGISLYLTMLILAVLSASLLALSSMSISQIRVIWSSADSVGAFYAADSGTEEALYNIRKLLNTDDFSGIVDDKEFEVIITSGTSGTIVRSIGKNRDARRAIEVKY